MHIRPPKDPLTLTGLAFVAMLGLEFARTNLIEYIAETIENKKQEECLTQAWITASNNKSCDTSSLYATQNNQKTRSINYKL